jgi:hypothetical protein
MERTSLWKEKQEHRFLTIFLSTGYSKLREYDQPLQLAHRKGLLSDYASLFTSIMVSDETQYTEMQLRSTMMHPSPIVSRLCVWYL